jgi:hypothetical protein
VYEILFWGAVSLFLLQTLKGKAFFDKVLEVTPEILLFWFRLFDAKQSSCIPSET